MDLRAGRTSPTNRRSNNSTKPLDLNLHFYCGHPLSMSIVQRRLESWLVVFVVGSYGIIYAAPLLFNIHPLWVLWCRSATLISGSLFTFISLLFVALTHITHSQSNRHCLSLSLLHRLILDASIQAFLGKSPDKSRNWENWNEPKMNFSEPGQLLIYSSSFVLSCVASVAWISIFKFVMRSKGKCVGVSKLLLSEIRWESLLRHYVRYEFGLHLFTPILIENWWDFLTDTNGIFIHASHRPQLTTRAQSSREGYQGKSLIT